MDSDLFVLDLSVNFFLSLKKRSKDKIHWVSGKRKFLSLFSDIVPKNRNSVASVENKARPPARQRAKNCVGGQGAL